MFCRSLYAGDDGRRNGAGNAGIRCLSVAQKSQLARAQKKSTLLRSQFACLMQLGKEGDFAVPSRKSDPEMGVGHCGPPFAPDDERTHTSLRRSRNGRP